jgi:hypothetical protein
MKNTNLKEHIDEQILTGTKIFNGILTIAVLHYTAWAIIAASTFIYNIF